MNDVILTLNAVKQKDLASAIVAAMARSFNDTLTSHG